MPISIAASRTRRGSKNPMPVRKPFSPKGKSSPPRGVKNKTKNYSKDRFQSKKRHVVEKLALLSKVVTAAPNRDARVREDIETLSSVFYNPVNSSHEILGTITDFVDTSQDVAAPYLQYAINMTKLFSFPVPISGMAFPAARPTGFRIYALPAFSLETESSALLVLFGLPVSMGASTANDNVGGTAATRTTLLTPTSVSDWVLVGSWNQKTIDNTGQILWGTQEKVVMGTIAVFEPDGITPSGVQVQLMIEVDFAQALPTFLSVLVSDSNGTSSALFTGPGDDVTNLKNVLMQVTGTGKRE